MIEVKAKPRGVLRKVVENSKEVLNWRAVGDRLRLSVNDPAGAQSHLGSELIEAGADVSILREAKIGMEDVFIHLMEQKEKQA